MLITHKWPDAKQQDFAKGIFCEVLPLFIWLKLLVAQIWGARHTLSRMETMAEKIDRMVRRDIQSTKAYEIWKSLAAHCPHVEKYARRRDIVLSDLQG